MHDQAGHVQNGAAPLVRKNNGSLVLCNAERLNGPEGATAGRHGASP